MRYLQHQPVFIWLLSSMLLAASLLYLSPHVAVPRVGQDMSSPAPEKADPEHVVYQLAAIVSSPPAGSSVSEKRAWLEGVKVLAIRGAEMVESSGDVSSASLWVELLNIINEHESGSPSPRDSALAVSRVTTHVRVMEGHYRMR